MPFLGKMAMGMMSVRAEQAAGLRDAAVLGRDFYGPAGGPAGGATRPFCGAVGCSSGWMRPWKKRGRPIFEDAWGCSGECLRALVRTAVRREVGTSSSDVEEAPHRHRVPLGLVLLAQGWITHPQLQAALQAQKASGQGRIGDWLVHGCGLAQERIVRGLGAQWNCPVLSTDGFSPEAMARVMPKRFVAEFGLVPLRVAGSTLLYLAFADGMDAGTALAVETMSGLAVESGLLATAAFDAVRKRVLEAESVPVTVSLVSDAEAMSAAMVKHLEQRQPVAARLVRVNGYYWMRMWLESGAMGRTGTLPQTVDDVQDYIFMLRQ